jgi:hypothetical protein
LKLRSVFLAAAVLAASSAAMADDQSFDISSLKPGETRSFSDVGTPFEGGGDLLTFTGLSNLKTYDLKFSFISTVLFDTTFGESPGMLRNDVLDPDGIYESSFVAKGVNVPGTRFKTTPEGSFSVALWGDSRNAAYLGTVEVMSPAAAVPEPASVALMFAGLGVVGFLARRRRQV